MIDRLSRYVATRSVSREEDALATLAAHELEAAGLRVQRRFNNVWCEIGDAPRPRLLLNSHLDTVPAAAGWRGDPWTPRIDGGRLIGLGANDAKGCVTAMIEAALSIKLQLDQGRGLGGTLVLALTAEEEISGQGLGTILEHLRPLDAALVGEPTDLTPMIAQRGLLILRCTARGRARHPANTPADTPDNAIMNACADLIRVREFDWGEPHSLLGRCHAHVTRIAGGVANNVIPDACVFTLDIRTTPNQPHERLVQRLRSALRSEISVHSDRLVPVQTDERSRIVRAVRRALHDRQPAGSPAMSDMVFLSGIPAVKIGPGQSPRSHTPDEFITLDELERGRDAYERIIRAYFAEGAE